MDFGYPYVSNVRKELVFSNGRYCELPSEYLKSANKNIIEEFYTKVLSESSNKEIESGIDPLGFTFISLDFICYIGLVASKKQKGKYRNLSKKYPKNKFYIDYLKKQIQFEYDLLNFNRYG